MHCIAVRRVVFILLCACVSPNLEAGPLDKAFAALREFDYFKARKIFLKQARKDPAPSWYGLSVIAGREDNPFHDLDSAYAYIQRSDAAFTVLQARQRERIARLGVDHEAIVAQREHIHAVAWERATREHSIEGYDRFLRTYFLSSQAAAAEANRDHLAFQVVRELNTSEAYRDYIARYPRSREIYEARSRLQQALFREGTADGDLGSYVRFIREHPDSPYLRDAEDAVFRLSTPGRTVQEYRKFIAEHPDNHRVPDAWRSIYDRYTRDLNVGNITQFLKDHPDYPFIEELAEDFRTATLVLYPFRRGGLWGFLDEKGIERIRAEYEWVEPFVGGQALVSRDGQVGTINRSGKPVIPIVYEDVHDAAEGTAVVERGGRMGAVDRSGELVVPMQFEELGDLQGGLAFAMREGMYGYVDARGNTVIPFTFRSAGSFRNGLAVVEQEGGFGVIDRKGNVIVPFEFDWVEGFQDQVSRVRKGDRFGVISPFGDLLTPVQHEYIGPFRDGLALVVDGRRAGYCDMAGRWRIPQQYETAEGVRTWGDFHNGMARVQQGGKRCLIDTMDRKVLPCQFVDLGDATGALIPVKRRNKWGYVDLRGRNVVDARYDMAWEMHGGYARVRNGDLYGLVDSTGREVVSPRFTSMADMEHGHFIVGTGEGMGLMAPDGRMVVPAHHDALQLVDDKLARVERGGLLAYVRIADGSHLWKEEGFDLGGSP